MSTQELDTLELVRLFKKYRFSDAYKSDAAFRALLAVFDTDLKKLASRYYISGSDPQDVLQECRLGLCKAADDFTETGGMSFRNFAINLCVKRHIITAMAAANRKKYDVHNNAVSLDTPITTGDDDAEHSLADFIPDTNLSVLDQIIIREEYMTLRKDLSNKLTDLEGVVFDAYGLDESYKDIAVTTSHKSKTVDNALMRIRKKAIEVFSEYLKKQQLENQAINKLEKLPISHIKTLSQDELNLLIEPILAKIKQNLKSNTEEEDLLLLLPSILTPFEESIFIGLYGNEPIEEIFEILDNKT